MSKRIYATIIWMLVLFSSIFAQELPQEGDVIRVFTRTGKTITGKVSSVSSEGLSVLVESKFDSQILPENIINESIIKWNDILKIEKLTSASQNFMKYFAIAWGTSALLGGTIGGLTWTPCPSDSW